MDVEGPTRSGWRTRAWLAVAAALFLPAVLAVTGGLSTWHLVLALLGLVALCGAVLQIVAEHREMVTWHSWLDVVSGLLGTTAVLLTFGGAPLERAGAMGVVDAVLTLACLGGLVVVAGLAAVLVGEVGAAGDRRTALLAVGATCLLGAGAIHVLGAAGLSSGGPPVVVLLAGAGCAGVVAALVVSPPRDLRRRPSGVGQRAVGSFVIIGEAATSLLLAPPEWGSRIVVLVAIAALVVAGVRLAVLLRDVTSLHDARALAVTDEVTGLGNRRSLLADVSALQRLPGVERGGAALLVLDLDDLHGVTDVWGREVGDHLLRRVADRLAPFARASRIDGGTFAVLLPGGDDSDALRTAAALQGLLVAPFPLPQGSSRLRSAAGVALLDGGVVAEGAEPAVDVLRRAEAAASHSRARGGEPVLHDAAFDVAAAARADLATALTAAIDTEQLVLHYQPQLLLGAEVVHGAEALVRWNDPEHGFVPPDVFVPLAEELGLQGRLTRWVVCEALHEVARWRAAGSTVPVSVNLSPSDLRPELVDDVARALLAAQVPGSALVLEITETGIVSDPEGAAAVLTALNELGVEISIDDYGTGYSSLSLLMALPVAELKIDRVFVRDLATDARSAVVVRTTVDLAHSLGLRVVAEGVETPEVLAQLAALGCDVSQGYLHSRPLPAAEVRAWLTDGGVQQPVGPAVATRP